MANGCTIPAVMMFCISTITADQHYQLLATILFPGGLLLVSSGYDRERAAFYFTATAWPPIRDGVLRSLLRRPGMRSTPAAVPDAIVIESFPEAPATPVLAG